eukprot:15480331-Alexandrium_andersonii.AAC.1
MARSPRPQAARKRKTWLTPHRQFPRSPLQAALEASGPRRALAGRPRGGLRPRRPAAGRKTSGRRGIACEAAAGTGVIARSSSTRLCARRMSSRQIGAIGPRRPSSLAVVAAPPVHWMSGLPSLKLWGTWTSICWPEKSFKKVIAGAAPDAACSTGR